MSGLAETMGKLRQSFAGLPSIVRVALVMTLIIGIAGGVYSWASNYAKTSQYEALFSDLDSKDASEITQRLTQLEVPYKISSDGTTILVPSTDVLETRLALAGEGLPRGGVVGFELMDQLSFGATDFDRRVNYLRALTGELTRTIREIDGVENARVHIVIPENSYFVTKTKPATAAVFLKLGPMVELDKLQIKGIIHLVSRSVEGLKPEDVAIVDLYGHLLSGEALGALEEQSGQNLEIQGTFQAELESSLQALLERVLGPGNVVTKVAAELNFDEKTIDSVLFQPTTEGILRSMQELEETFKSDGAAASGVPGTTSNVPGYSTTGTGGSSQSSKTETTRNFEISEIKERTVVAPGSVKRLSVAVVINKVLDDDAKSAIQNTIQAAIGADPARNDVVSVSSMAFDNTILDEMKKAMETPEPEPKPIFSLTSPVVIAAAGGALLLLIIMVIIMVPRRRKKPTADVLTKMDVGQALRAAAEAAAALDAQEEKKPDPEAEKRRKLREDVEQAAKANPESVAAMIRTWITDDRR